MKTKISLLIISIIFFILGFVEYGNHQLASATNGWFNLSQMNAYLTLFSIAIICLISFLLLNYRGNSKYFLPILIFSICLLIGVLIFVIYRPYANSFLPSGFLASALYGLGEYGTYIFALLYVLHFIFKKEKTTNLPG